MIIETPDEQALDLLSSPRAVVVRLQRRVTYNASPTTVHTQAHTAGRGWQAAVDYPSTAVFWPGPAYDEGKGRRLDGEIQLSKYLKPSSALMHFSITVSTTSLSTACNPVSYFFFHPASTMLWYSHSRRLPSTPQTKTLF